MAYTPSSDPHTLRVQRKQWQAYVRSACNKLAAGYDGWQAKVSEGRRALTDLVIVRASTRSLDTLHLGSLATVPGLLAASMQKLALQEQDSLSRLQTAMAGMRIAGAELQACWSSAVSVDVCPVFASMSLSGIGRLFQLVSQASAEDTLAKERVLMALAPGCRDERNAQLLISETTLSQKHLEGALLAWTTDLAVVEAVNALQGALYEEMRGF